MSLDVERRPGSAFLSGDDTRPALVIDGGPVDGGPVDGDTVDHGHLRSLVDDRLAELDLSTRSLVVLAGETSLEFVVTYLALLRGGHVPMLAGAHERATAEQWDASASVVADRDGWRIDRRHRRQLDLHDDLALLLSTSGSTGAAKLVRLSHENLVANATSIVEYLGLRHDDVGITSLPLHYCYGLSLLHSHLLAGASIVLTRASVVDPCFRSAMQRHGVTGLAGVPHTYDLLERAGPDLVAVPSLRLLTQAGGRMAPERTVAWARRAGSWGARWFTMYGQTEATARIAFVPPDLVLEAPHTIGIPVPGGELEVRPDAGVEPTPDEVGELVYRGPNVMLGYATSVADLALGREVEELMTGDLARRCERTGLIEIVGRRSRFVKPFGVRVDLDDLERRLIRATWCDPGAHELDLTVVGDDDGLVVVAPMAQHAVVRGALRSILSMPDHVCRIVDADIPRTSSGKVAGAQLLAAVRHADRMDGHDLHRDRPGGPVQHADAADPDRSPTWIATTTSTVTTATTATTFPMTSSTDRGVADVFRTVLGRREVHGHDTFVSLGGDSLSYVECSVRLEALLGTLPRDWHLRPVDDFPATRRPGRLRRVDTSAVLRTAGILAVVATHMGIVFFPGGAHLMLGVVGYNVSRFLLGVEPLRARWRATGRALARVAVPTVAWTLAGMAAFGAYSTGTALLVNNYVGPRSHADDHWHFWFVEVLVHLTLATVALSSVSIWRDVDRRHPYAAPLAVLGVTLVLRMEWAWMGDWYNLRFRTHGVASFFVLGWLVHRSTTWRTRLATTAVCVAVVPGFFDRPQREWFIIGGLVLLLWSRQVPVPGVLVRPVAWIAAASMWIYLSHFTIWPLLDAVMEREVAYPLTVAAGVSVWAAARWIEPRVVRGVTTARDVMVQRRQAATAAPW